jgi:hypothetical protein
MASSSQASGFLMRNSHSLTIGRKTSKKEGLRKMAPPLL